MCLPRSVYLRRLASLHGRSLRSLVVESVKQHNWEHALALYQQVQDEDPLVLDGHIFVALLKACSKLEDSHKGSNIHAEIARKGLLGDMFIGSTLIDMYSKCGSPLKGQEVFDKLPTHNEVTWTALISGYAENGLGEESLRCLERMKLSGMPMDASAFVCGLKACGMVGLSVLSEGQNIHADIVQRGFLETNVFIGGALVGMYVKCGHLIEATSIFNSLKVRNTVVWTALLSGYVDHGFGNEALSLSKQMQLDGISPNIVTFVCCSKACGITNDIQKANDLYTEIVIQGLEGELLVGNALVDMYAKCGSIATAGEVFERHPVQDVVSWNTLIAGHVEYGCIQQALCYLEQMHQEGICPSVITYFCYSKACGSVAAAEKGKKVHGEVILKGLESELDNGILVDMYAKCGLLTEAFELFYRHPVKTTAAWNSLIVEYAERGQGEEGLCCLKEMQSQGISPDVGTLICALKACSSMRAIEKGQEIHIEVTRKGLETEASVGNILVDMYGKCGMLLESQQVFDKLSNHSVVSWTSLLVGFFERGCSDAAIYCFEEMQHEGISPNFISYICSLKACASMGATTKGRSIHMAILKKGLEGELLVGNILVDMYAKCGTLGEAQQVFDNLAVQDIVSSNALISGYAQLGICGNAFHTFDKLIASDVEPDLTTFISIFNACSHAGLVHKGYMYFEILRNKYGLVPTRDHFTCISDTLARAGHLSEAVTVIETMPFLPDIVIWHIILGACRKWGHLELARYAFDQALQLDEKDRAAYVCMSNIYLDAFVQNDTDMGIFTEIPFYIFDTH